MEQQSPKILVPGAFFLCQVPDNFCGCRETKHKPLELLSFPSLGAGFSTVPSVGARFASSRPE